MKKLILTTTLIAIAATGASAKPHWWEEVGEWATKIDKGLDHLHCKKDGGDVPNWFACPGKK